MNMDHMNKWLTLVANLGVIAGIAILAIELRQNSNAVHSQTRSQISIAYAELLQTQQLDQALLEALIRLDSDEPIERVDLRRVMMNVLSHLRLGENSFYQLRQGNYSEGEFEGEKNWWQNYLSQPVTREIWNNVKYDFSPRFREELDALIAENSNP